MTTADYPLDLMREDNFLGSWKLLSAKQTPSSGEVEREEFKKAYASIFSRSTDTMNW
jgi:hypothetical protein